MRFTAKEIEVIYGVLRVTNQALTTHTLSVIREIAALYREERGKSKSHQDLIKDRDTELGTTMDFRDQITGILRKIEGAGKSGQPPAKKRKRSGRKKR
jgi:hypothetical protein